MSSAAFSAKINITATSRCRKKKEIIRNNSHLRAT